MHAIANTIDTVLHTSTRCITGSVLVLCIALFGAALAPQAQAARIKEVAAVEGVRSNQLTGFGLVVGLDGTGDQTTQMPYTSQGIANYLQQLGITLPAASASSLQMKNVAAVLVTAQLPAFARPGQAIDVNVSSVGNSKSLKGGMLIATPLKGADGEIYAIAQGSLIIAGAGAAAAGSKVQVNHLSAGRIPNGAQVERSVPTPLQEGNSLTLGLQASDFQTARKVAQAINTRFGAGVAQAMDGRTIKVLAPALPDARVTFMAELEELPLENSVAAAKVVINARTGSIVMNGAVTLNPVAVAHGNLSITISNTPSVSQPNPLSGGQTTVTQQADIQIKNEPGMLIPLPAAAQLTEVVRALNSLGATPQDLLAILQAIKAAGALNAELEVI
ncbi:MAG: flagellar basal body P-ring protein FlgI [Rhodoferax sp.]|nr:flagellar basal body P-ring protein FlgI [Betaproteobacteria bacterium]NCN98079.1 flagellar basal body P-ring protein FlgI [Rhodoferax sp.]PIZ21649.1 MAG: flagellar biosynthesis protein FlgI [Comamonadaceae bacterium CG_4_10_14_0_8_um_filter_57_29]PJC14181.1 MAG: flagellar biosynthesis protein FlgI [Comamonadaceae bacterium CG_4_9_14_0_8_um_filter_57_21]NCP82076.1 flagellar basal body P-ring protein FlgI [Rhodoferax sp.]